MKQFLGELLNLFSKWRAPSVVASYVSESGAVARFVFRSRDLSQDGRPKPRAFQPEVHPELRRYETSVCGLNGISPERLWELGRTVRASSGLTAIAALRLSVRAVRETGLRCEPAPEPGYPEHGVIVGWADDPEAKDKRLAQQVDLAALVSPNDVLRPNE